jgi:hypothetical protein
MKCPTNESLPELDDSADLTDSEARGATMTTSGEHLAALLKELLSREPHYTVGTLEVRRRRPYLYIRGRLVCTEGPAKVLVYRVDWLQNAS